MVDVLGPLEEDRAGDVDRVLALAVSSNEEIEWTRKCDVSSLIESLLFQIFNVGLGDCGFRGDSFGGRAAIGDDEVLL